MLLLVHNPFISQHSKKLKSSILPCTDVYRLIEGRRLQLESCLSLHPWPSFPSAITVVTVRAFPLAGLGTLIHW